jgi:heme exporter protein A
MVRTRAVFPVFPEVGSRTPVRTLLAVDTSQTLIDLDAVSVRAGSVHILRDVVLKVDAGEALGVFGANGAGKTTLLRLLATLIPPSAGTGTILGARLDGEDRYDVRPRIGYVGHVPGLYPEMTLAENLAFTADARGIDREESREALERVGLGGAADRLADRCSHGMQRRAEFARVLMTQPDLLLLDEPHSALDGDAVDLVEALVARTSSNGGAAILVSHDRDRVASMATRTVEIARGTVT